MHTPLFLTLILLGWASVKGQTVFDGSSLLKAPDLSPQLTHEEVAKEFIPWVEKMQKVASRLKPEQQEAAVASFSEARTALGSKLPTVTHLALYSLFPIDASHIRQYEPSRADELEKLPRFHDYPILGEIKIDDASQANRWVSFLRDQIIPGGYLACDFKPRHGFRLTTSNGNIDILMCFSCNQLALFGSSKLDTEFNPVFSQGAEAQLNQLFDKLKIRRDIPPE